MQSRIAVHKPASGQVPATASDSSQLAWVCRETLRAIFPSFRNAEISASFYPYVGLTHTIRRRGSAWILRVSDHCVRAPHRVLQSIAVLLGCRVLRRRAPEEWVRVYREFCQAPLVDASVRERRLRRGRKAMRAAGRHHTLRDYCEELNRRFFNGQVEVARIGWSHNRSWFRLGHYDPLHRTITISAVLDSPIVPPMVLSFLVYHEMLHAVFDAEQAGSRRSHHSRAFRAAERSYSDYTAATEFLSEFCRTRGRMRKGRSSS